MLELKLEAPNYFFIPLDNELLKVYNEGFSLGEIFKVKNMGIKTNADGLLVNTKLDKLKSNIDEYMNGESNIEVGEFTKSKGIDLNGAYKILPYRVFDNRHYYDSMLTNVRCQNLTKHESIEDNCYLSFCSSAPDNDSFSHLLVTKSVPECKLVKGKKSSHSAPLYILNDQNKIESNMYLNFKPSIADNYQFSHILITKQTSECHLFAGKLTNYTAPLYILNDQNKIESNFKEE